MAMCFLVPNLLLSENEPCPPALPPPFRSKQHNKTTIKYINKQQQQSCPEINTTKTIVV